MRRARDVALLEQGVEDAQQVEVQAAYMRVAHSICDKSSFCKYSKPYHVGRWRTPNPAISGLYFGDVAELEYDRAGQGSDGAEQVRC
jgi:hypothetical protein